MADLKIFISHASEDADLVGKLVQCLDGALSLNKGELLCTSIPGYKLETGADAPTRIRDAIKSGATVIGVVTPAALQRHWVIFELGAAWGLERQPKPLLDPALDFKALPAALNNAQAHKLNDEDGLAQLLDELGDQGIHLKPTAVRNKAVREFVAYVNAHPSRETRAVVAKISAEKLAHTIRESLSFHYNYRQSSSSTERARNLLALGDHSVVFKVVLIEQERMLRDKLREARAAGHDTYLRAMQSALIDVVSDMGHDNPEAAREALVDAAIAQHQKLRRLGPQFTEEFRTQAYALALEIETIYGDECAPLVARICQHYGKVASEFVKLIDRHEEAFSAYLKEHPRGE